MMKTLPLIFAVVLLASSLTAPPPAQANDDLDFATPVVVDQSPVCADSRCQTATSTTRVFERRNRPVVRWFRQRQPVRRVLRGVAGLFCHRCRH